MILFCGDPHGHFGHIIEAVQEHRPAAVILLGDLQASRPLEIELAPMLDQTEIWFIHGNHDTDPDADHDHLFCSALASRNLHGRVVEVAGLRIAGLCGVFQGQVCAPPKSWTFDTQKEYISKCGKGNQWRDGLPRIWKSLFRTSPE